MTGLRCFAAPGGRTGGAGVSLLAGFVAVVLTVFLPSSAAAAPVPLAQAGSFGTGAGQLNNPKSVAIDGAGNLYVVEQSGQRISVFGPDGSFIRAFGWGVDTGAATFEVCTTASTCQAAAPGGGGVGQLNFPRAAAIDGAGNLYVVDNSQRVNVFDTAGPSFTRAFGWGVDTGAAAFEVCTTASTCQEGSFGGGAGQLSFAVGLGLDGAGGVYVADSDNRRISVFNSAGPPSFTHAFGWGVDTGAAAFEVCTTGSTCQAGIDGGGAGQFGTVGGVTLDGAGTLYVGTGPNRRIDVFDVTAAPSFSRAFGWGVDTGAPAFEVCTTASTCQAGISGGGAGQLTYPIGLSLDGAGSLYVAELQGGHRIDVFDAGGSFTDAFGWGVDTGAPAFETCTTASTCQVGSAGSGIGQLDDPQGVAIDCRGAAWVADSGNDRLQRFGEAGTAPAPCTPPVVPPPPPPGGNGAPPPSNAFTIDGLHRRTLKLTLASAGAVEVKDPATGTKKRLKSSTATGGPGTIEVTLRLTKTAKQKLELNRKIKVNARITFTPHGGTAASQTTKLKVKKK